MFLLAHKSHASYKNKIYAESYKVMLLNFPPECCVNVTVLENN